MTDASAIDVRADTRKSGNFLYISAVVFLCAWVIVPIYFLLINTLSSPETVSSFPKPFFPEFDFGSLAFFAGFEGMLSALKNSVLVAGMTMIMSVLIGAPAGYALSRFEFRGKGLFRLLILLTRAFPLPLLALPLAVLFIRTGLDDTAIRTGFGAHDAGHPVFSADHLLAVLRHPDRTGRGRLDAGMQPPDGLHQGRAAADPAGITASAIFAFVISWNEVFAAAVLTIENRTLTAFLLQNLGTSPMHLKFAGGFILVVPALIFIFAVRKYLFAMWGIANR